MTLEIGRKESKQAYLDELYQKQFEGILKDPLHKRKSGKNVRLNVPVTGVHNSTNSFPDTTSNLSQTNENQSQGATRFTSNSDSRLATHDSRLSNEKKEVATLSFDDYSKESSSTPRRKVRRNRRRGTSLIKSNELDFRRINQKLNDILELISKGKL